jgi:tetratricopeptide (TPR) repeat protein
MEVSRGRMWGVVGVLLLAMAGQLALYASRQSQTWDEGDHIYAGYRSWKDADFGLNPEHPPLVKLLATIPLLGMSLEVPPLQDRYFKHEAFLGGRDFVYGNDADRIHALVRIGPALLTLAMGLVAFLAGREMFGAGAGLIALVLLAFDPNVLAHGALVTTDVGFSLFMLAAVYGFYRYVRAPSVPRLVLVGVATGLGMATKHTGVLIPLVLVLLAVTELWGPTAPDTHRPRRGARALRLTAVLAVAGVIAFALLWAFYGFRYAARPGSLALNPGFADLVGFLSPPRSEILSALARWHLFPESYLYGFADVFVTEGFYRSYVLGKAYPHGVWFYFPVALLVKSTLTFLVLPIVIAAAVLTKRLAGRREILFLAVPPLVHLLVAVSSRMNIGIRHVMPVYAFLAVLGGGALWAFARRGRSWKYVVAGLLLLHVGSSVRAFPAWMAYSNELWGGPTRTYEHLSDSNTDWGQQLESLAAYLDERGVRECWFAYFAQATVDWSYYGIPCKPLPTADGFWFGDAPQVPPVIEGTVVISAGVLSGFEVGPEPLHLYAPFQKVQPTAQIDGGLFVFDGRFQIPLASALALTEKAEDTLEAGRADEALRDARRALGLAPTAVKPNLVAGDALVALGRKDEARSFYEAALHSARTIAPEFQADWIGTLEGKLQGE